MLRPLVSMNVKLATSRAQKASQKGELLLTSVLLRNKEAGSWKLLDAISLHRDARSFKPHKSKLALRKKFAFEHWSQSGCKTSVVPNSK